MKKWTTSTRVAFPTPTMEPHVAVGMTTRSKAEDHEGLGGGGGVSLLRVLQVRRKPLNEIEVWSLLGQAGNALKGQKGRLVTPRSTICTPSGKVALQSEAVTESYYIHPRLSGKVLQQQQQLSASEAETAAVFSLARTAEWALDYGEDELNRVSEALRSLLSRMQTLDLDKSPRLENVLSAVADHWGSAVGATPVGRFVSQMCRMTQTWQQSSVPALRSTAATTSTTTVVTVMTEEAEKKEVEVEFSRLETSSSSSCSAEDEENVVRPPTQVTSPFAASMPNLNNNVEQVKEEEERLRPPVVPPKQQRGQYGRRLEYQPPGTYENFVLRSNLSRGRSASSHEFTKRSTTAAPSAVRRNPSRLYRVVRPLTEVTHAPSPATKRCIGPEFVVMGESDPVTLDLHCSAASSRNAPCRTVQVVMLDGKRLRVLCNPLTVTAGEVLDNVLSHEDIRETAYFALALREGSSNDEEYWCLSGDAKLSKVAPSGWKQPPRSHPNPNSVSSDSVFVVYLRFRHFPDDVDELRDPKNKHLFYLQLRRDVSEARYHMSASAHLGLAGKVRLFIYDLDL